MKIKKYLKYLNEKKKLIGLSDWIILLDGEYKQMNTIAHAEFDIYEKTINITLSDEFKEFSNKRIYNILMHELVHARISIYNAELYEIISQVTRVREEHLVNDLTNGFESVW